MTRVPALRDPAERLPGELVCDVFRKLDFSGRLAVSHVCTSWRQLALSDLRLWAQWRPTSAWVWRSAEGTMVAALTEMLARSSPLPFSLEWATNVPDSISELVISNARRMEVLLLCQHGSEDVLERILAQDVPVLRHFSFYPNMQPDMRLSLPARWATAPFLESLSLGCWCLWPPGCTVPTLRSFSGCVPDTPGVHVSLSAMFPNVTNLVLYRFTNEVLSRLEPLPRSLEALKLSADEGIDCATLLRGWKTTALRELEINWASSSACTVEVFRLFVRVFSGPWSLSATGAFAELCAPTSDRTATHRYSVLCATDFWYDHAAHIIPLCNQLRELDLPLFDLLPLCDAHAVFPALAAITIELVEQDDGLWDTLRDRPRVHAPALGDVSVKIPAHKDFDSRSAEIAATIVRAFRSPKLASVVIRTHAKQQFPCDDVAGLEDLADRVEARDSAGNVLHVYSSAAEGTASATA